MGTQDVLGSSSDSTVVSTHESPYSAKAPSKQALIAAKHRLMKAKEERDALREISFRAESTAMSAALSQNADTDNVGAQQDIPVQKIVAPDLLRTDGSSAKALISKGQTPREGANTSSRKQEGLTSYLNKDVLSGT